MSTTFTPSLTAAIIFRRIGSHDRYRKRGLQTSFANGRKKKLVKVHGCSHKRNARREYKRFETKQSNYSTYSSYQEMQGCRRNEMQTKHTDALN